MSSVKEAPNQVGHALVAAEVAASKKPATIRWFFHPQLKFEYWDEIDSDIDERISRLRKNTNELSGGEFHRANAFQLAATDLFVEKAQVHLTLRAHKYTMAGITLALFCVAILSAIIWIATTTNFTKYGVSWQLVTLFALRSAGIAGFAGAAVYFSASLSRAFFHEATTLYNRRHALRFGRMFVYLKYGESSKERDDLLSMLKSNHSVNSVSPAEEGTEGIVKVAAGDRLELSAVFQDRLLAYLYRDVSAEELEKAFGWNLEIQTGFRDMKPELMSSNIYSRTVDVMGKLVESLAKIKSASAERRGGE